MRLFIPLTRDEFEQLKTLAQTERRRPQDQAAVLLVRAISSQVPTQHTQADIRREERRELDHAAA